jgi:hypothetical protein
MVQKMKMLVCTFINVLRDRIQLLCCPFLIGSFAQDPHHIGCRLNLLNIAIRMHWGYWQAAELTAGRESSVQLALKASTCEAATVQGADDDLVPHRRIPHFPLNALRIKVDAATWHRSATSLTMLPYWLVCQFRGGVDHRLAGRGAAGEACRWRRPPQGQAGLVPRNGPETPHAPWFRHQSIM